MNDIKGLVKNLKNGDFQKNNKNILPGYSNRVWHGKMCNTHNEMLEKTGCRRNRTARQGKH